jgi:hypothetical protein
MHTELFHHLSGADAGTDTSVGGAGFVGAELGSMIGLALMVLAGLGAVLLIVAALVQISQAVHLREPARARWVLSVVFAPVFGAIAWFAVGNRPHTG